MQEIDMGQTLTIWIAVNNSFNRGGCYAAVHEVPKMDNYLDGSWEKFEQWIREVDPKNRTVL